MMASADETLKVEAFSSEGIRDLMHQVNSYTKDNPYKQYDRGWIRGTYYTGVMGAYHATQDDTYLNQAIAWAEKHEWLLGTAHPGANHLFASMTWAELNLMDPDLAKIQDTIDFIKDSENPKSPACGEVWYGHSADFRSVIYADALYAAPIFSMLYKATGDKSFLEVMDSFFWNVTDLIFDQEDHLYYRDDTYIGRESPHKKKVFWSRGNGWVFAAIPRILQHLDESHPTYPRFLEVYKKMAASLATRQHDDGFWRANLADPDHYRMPESSGTAFFTFGLAWGINKGILDRETYLPVVTKGWKSIVGAVHPNGNFGWVQPVDAEPRPSLPVTTHEYATGLFLLAGSEMLKLVDAGILTSAIAESHLVANDIILPNSALRNSKLSNKDHPLAEKINGFTSLQAKKPKVEATGLDRSSYLEIISGQIEVFRKYQDDEGRIIDPVTNKEMYYSTPCYAHSVASLASASYNADPTLIESGMKALDISLKDLAADTVPGNHGDFYTWPALLAYELFEPLATRDRVAQWNESLAAIDPLQSYEFSYEPYEVHEHDLLYANYGKHEIVSRKNPIKKKHLINWNIVNVSGEFLRHKLGHTDLQYIDFSLTMQLANFTSKGMYNEGGNPLAYDLFSRHYLAGMLDQGYRSFAYTTYRDLLWRGAWTSLLMQSPTGELPTGHRSSHHIWNEAEQAVLFEIYASAYAQAGKKAEAGAFKRAARLSLESIKDWIRPDGTGFILKNRFPKAERHGYESYSQHTCYNLLACSMLAQAWEAANDDIEESASPADLGGFAFETPTFHKVFANSAGSYIEYDTNGDHKYNPTGLLRIHFSDSNPQIGPSDGIAPLFGGEGNNFAVGPAWKTTDGTWTKLADLSDTQAKVTVLKETAKSVELEVSHTIGERATLTERFLIRDGAVTAECTIEGLEIETLRIYYPILVSDGESETRQHISKNTAELTRANKAITFEALKPRSSKLVLLGKQYKHRNGLAEPVYFDVSGNTAKYRISRN